MFDWSSLIDRAAEMFKGSDFDALTNADLAGHLSELGVDSSLLESMSLDEIQTTLSEAGVDISSLSETQLADIVSNLAADGEADGNLLSSILEKSSG